MISPDAYWHIYSVAEARMDNVSDGVVNSNSRVKASRRRKMATKSNIGWGVWRAEMVGSSQTSEHEPGLDIVNPDYPHHGTREDRYSDNFWHQAPAIWRLFPLSPMSESNSSRENGGNRKALELGSSRY